MTLHNRERMIGEAQEEFKGIVHYVLTEAQGQELHEVERGLLQRLLALGLTLLKLFLAQRGTGYLGEKARTPDGRVVPYHSTKTMMSFSIFGKVPIARAYYWQAGVGGGLSPLDALLHWPERCYASLLQEWAGVLAVRGAYDHVTETLEKLLRVTVGKRPVETSLRETGGAVDAFSHQQPAPAPATEGPILVAAVDGKGVPMRKGTAALRPRRRKKGEKSQQKRQATVVALYTIDRHPRTVEDVVREVQASGADSSPGLAPERPAARPQPQNKRVRATLEGKDAAFEELRRQVQERDPRGEKDRVALTDGDRALHRKVRQSLKGFCLVLDLWHVLEYLWKAAHVFHREGSPEAEAWVHHRLRWLLQGRVGAVIGGLRQSLTKRAWSPARRRTLEQVIGYLHQNRRAMRYDLSLARGYPIGSGVAEGACRHLVKDRMELAGMRWTPAGAEPMLQLRAVDINGDWEAFWAFHVAQERKRLYPQSAEEPALAAAA